MQVFVYQAKLESPHYLPLLNASHWFWERGYDVIPFSSSQLQESELLDAIRCNLENSVVRATPEATRFILKSLGLNEPLQFDLPTALTPWVKRFTWETTLGQVREQVDSEISFNPFFIRSIDDRHYFKGTVVYGLRDLIPSAALPDSTQVLAQQKIELASEWKVFVLRQRIVHFAHIKGNPLVFPDREGVLEAIAKYGECPIAYGMVWGISAAGDSMLLEINDGITCGGGGMHGMKHVAMIEALWREWAGQPDNGVGDSLPL